MEKYLPEEIEKKSFEIITEELRGVVFDKMQEPIIKRVIHTTADFEYAKNLIFSKGVIEKALNAIKNGADIVTDTKMAMSGINKKTLEMGAGRVHCFISDEDVAIEAKARGMTRSAVSMEKACLLAGRPLIIAIGNAPTALIKLNELIYEGKLNPVVIIAVPVGFVNVVESKELILSSDRDYIVARGRKGGSNVAAAIINALLYMAYPVDFEVEKMPSNTLF